MRIATRCGSIEQFVETFHRFCDEQSVFISTLAQRPVGLETAFSIDLADGTPALRGIGIIVDAWSTAANPFGRPGVQFGIRRLTADSERVLEKLLVARAVAKATTPAEVAVAPTARAPRVVLPPPIPPPKVAKPAEPESVARTPGSELVLPANPLTGINDESLGGFVDCTIYEETGTFFPSEPTGQEERSGAEEPPLLAPLARATPPSAPESAATPEPAAAAAPPAPLEPPLAAPYPPPSPFPLGTTPPPMMQGLAGPHGAMLADGLVPRLLRLDRRLIIAAPIALVVLILAIAVAAHGHGSRSSPPAGTAASSSATAPARASTAPAPVSSPATAAPPAATGPSATAPDPGSAAASQASPAATADDATAEAGAPTVGDGPCLITVETTPAGSTVALDGQAIGPSPLTIAGPCRRRRLTVAHPRYQDSSRWVTPSEHERSVVDVTLGRPTHALLVLTIPRGVTISIDGRPAGTSPGVVKLMGFTTIPITLSKPGYQTITRRFYSKLAQDRLFVRLSRR